MGQMVCIWLFEFLGFSDKVAAREKYQVPLPAFCTAILVNKAWSGQRNGAFAFILNSSLKKSPFGDSVGLD